VKCAPAMFALVGLVIILSLNFGETGLSPIRGEPVPVAPGDANCDGEVDAADAALVLQDSRQQPTEMSCSAAADSDGNGVVDSVDALRTLR
jgi:Dockerin type I domain